jgi:type II secretory pathway component PulJ
MEVLIAVAAFAIVLAAINSVFYAALRLRNKMTEAFAEDLAMQHTLALLRRDIANILPPGGTMTGNLQTTPGTSSLTSSSGGGGMGTGTGFGASLGASASSMALLAAASRPGQSSPEFYTTTGAIDETSPWSEVQKVAYYLAPSTNELGRRDLIRSVTRNLLPSLQDQPVTTPLLNGVESIYFQYHDGSQWKDTWDSTTEATKLPTAIRAQITMAAAGPKQALPPPIEIVVPILVTVDTNATATATATAGSPSPGGGQ